MPCRALVKATFSRRPPSQPREEGWRERQLRTGVLPGCAIHPRGARAADESGAGYSGPVGCFVAKDEKSSRRSAGRVYSLLPLVGAEQRDAPVVLVPVVARAGVRLRTWAVHFLTIIAEGKPLRVRGRQEGAVALPHALVGVVGELVQVHDLVLFSRGERGAVDPDLNEHKRHVVLALFFEALAEDLGAHFAQVFGPLRLHLGKNDFDKLVV